MRAIQRKIPGCWAQGQPEAGAANQNCPVYKAIPLRKATQPGLEATVNQGSEANTTHRRQWPITINSESVVLVADNK